VHGATVVTVTHPGEHAGTPADAAVTAVPGCELLVRTADCVPVVLTGAGAGSVGVVHAGWRGLAQGVVDAAAEAMRALGSGPVAAFVGPHVRVGCYEFGDELEAVAAALGDGVRGRTTWGTPALDLTAATLEALERIGVRDVDDAGACTACTTRWFSWRARREHERFATVARLDP
jgi:YfiH family protein